VGTFVSGDVTTPRGQEDLLTGIGTTVGAVIAAGVGIWFLTRQLHTFPLFSRLVLNATASGGGEREAAGGLLTSMGRAHAAGPAAGDRGVAETDLRPSGRAAFGGRSYDVVTVGGYIAKGAPVQVTSVGRFRIEVEEAGA
jgi:hypothetical protein